MKLDTRQAAEFLKIRSKRSLEVARHRGGGPKYHKDAKGFVTYDTKDLVEWMSRKGVERIAYLRDLQLEIATMLVQAIAEQANIK